MLRVAPHVDRLAEQLTELGLVANTPVRQATTAEDLRDLDLLRAEIGCIPTALDACLRHVGGAWFAGDCPALNLRYATGVQYRETPVLPDPLVLPDAEYLRVSWTMYQNAVEDDPEAGDDGFFFDFAPDERHKANISGTTHEIEMAQNVADPVIHGIDGRPGITLVEYLRVSIAWGGMPGWSFEPDQAPAALASLRVRPDF
jgi:hypothetical protein